MSVAISKFCAFTSHVYTLIFGEAVVFHDEFNELLYRIKNKMYSISPKIVLVLSFSFDFLVKVINLCNIACIAKYNKIKCQLVV